MIRTITVNNTDKNNRLLENFPSAGPRPNITGMKKKFWGEDALCIKCGQYVYHVDFKTYNHFKGNE